MAAIVVVLVLFVLALVASMGGRNKSGHDDLVQQNRTSHHPWRSFYRRVNLPPKGRFEARTSRRASWA